MGKPTGFMEYERKISLTIEPKKRINNFNEFHVPLPKEEQKKQAARCMDCGVPFCNSGILLGGMTSGCPLNNLIPEWNDLLYNGNMEQALQRLLLTNNFPEFTSRVCPAPCEPACTCNVKTDPVAIKENEWAISEYGYESGSLKANPPKVRTDKRVAVIGSGPSGLAAADQLNRRGHLVTVYERSDRIGGLLMYGIPNMKLDKSIVERKVNIMKEEGITFLTGIDVGKDIEAEKLLEEYDCIILACGASNPRDIKVTGREAKGIYFAVDYLKGVTKSLLDSGFEDHASIDTRDKRVIVVGGGDTGNDCVGTAIRQGAAAVTQIEMMPKPRDARGEDNPWPEWPRICKTDYGQEEAIAVFGSDPRIYESTIKEFVADQEGRLQRIKVVKLERKYNPETKRLSMEEIPGSEYELEADYVFIAAGFLGAQDYVPLAFGVELDARTNVKTQTDKYGTTKDKIFTTGDMHRGQSLVVWAIREGREAAGEVDRYLNAIHN